MLNKLKKAGSVCLVSTTFSSYCASFLASAENDNKVVEVFHNNNNNANEVDGIVDNTDLSGENEVVDVTDRVCKYKNFLKFFRPAGDFYINFAKSMIFIREDKFLEGSYGVWQRLIRNLYQDRYGIDEDWSISRYPTFKFKANTCKGSFYYLTFDLHN